MKAIIATLIGFFTALFIHQTPVPVSTPIPSPTPTGVTHYTHDGPIFYFNYPQSWTLETTSQSLLSFITSNHNSLRITITPDKSKTIAEYLTKADKISQTAFEGKPSLQVQDTKKTEINGHPCIVREEYLAAADLNQTTTYFKTGNSILAFTLQPIRGNSSAPDRDAYQQLLNTLSFEPVNYTCPANGWVNCMPGPGPAKPECSREAMAWYQANCPNFQGGAL